jgi:chemotaxis protein MotB
MPGFFRFAKFCIGFCLAVSPLCGCVKTATYQAKVTELDQLRRKAIDREKTLLEHVSVLEHQGEEKDQQIAALGKDRDTLRKQLDDNTALVGELRGRLSRLGQDVEKLTSERGEISQSLKEAKDRLEELRKQKVAAEATAQTFRALVARLRSMIDAGQLRVVIRDGRMLIALPNDVLFDSGKIDIKPEGQIALARVAQALSSISGRRFLVAGHSDDLPIRTRAFPSNWELSAGRAIEVTKFLVQNGMKADTLAAASYGEFDPVVKNDSAEHRAQNRRIEIVLQPNLADLPPLDPKEG